MLHELLKSVVVVSTLATPTGSGGPVVFTSTGDKYIFTPPAPVKLLKWGIVISTDLVPVTQCLLSLSLRPTAGSNTARAVIDTLRTGTTIFVAGKGILRDPFTASTTATTPASEVAAAGPSGVVGNNTITSGQAQFVVIPGQEWVVDVTTAATTTGQGYIWIEYVLLPISKPSGYGTTDAGTVSLTENYTRVAS